MTSPDAMSVFLTGLTLSASLIVAIGAQNAFVLQQGLRRQHVWAVVTVCALLDIALMAAGVSGLAALLGRRPGWLAGLALCGALLLAVYGAAAFRRALQPSTQTVRTGEPSEPLLTVVAKTLSISLMNPHVYLDTVVLVGAVGARQPAASQGIFMAGAGLASVAWFFALGFGARVLAPWFARPQAWRMLDFVIGLTMVTLAVRLTVDALA